MSRNLLKTLLNASEKAANIARKCRSNENLLELLVQEKSGDEANPRFVKDFKTLADVLIQETIRHDVGIIFPELRENIKGEESPTFTNSLGDSVNVVIGDCREKTKACLATVLNGNFAAAEALATAVHQDTIYQEEDSNVEIPDIRDDLIDYTKIGIWIDPIDSTAEYIAGDTIFSKFPGITSTGLDCVTVLIGVYDKESGHPVMGVVNQPFHKMLDKNSYKGEVFWGISIDGKLSVNNLPTGGTKRKPNQVALFSSSEYPRVMELIKKLGYETAFSAGAGHKALKVITGEADLYLLSKPSTFKWDTCGPQSILKSLGGDIFDFKKSLKEKNPVPISYADIDGTEKCNSGGLIALRDLDLFPVLMEILFD